MDQSAQRFRVGDVVRCARPAGIRLGSTFISTECTYIITHHFFSDSSQSQWLHFGEAQGNGLGTYNYPAQHFELVSVGDVSEIYQSVIAMAKSLPKRKAK